MNSAYKFFVRFKQLDSQIFTASGEVLAPSYSEAATQIVNYHSYYGKILSMYIEELPGITSEYCGISMNPNPMFSMEGRARVYGTRS